MLGSLFDEEEEVGRAFVGGPVSCHTCTSYVVVTALFVLLLRSIKVRAFLPHEKRGFRDQRSGWEMSTHDLIWILLIS